MDMKTYIEGILNLEIVKRLYILRESEDYSSKTYLVSASGSEENRDLRSAILDKEFTYPPAEFGNFMNSLKKEGFKIFPLYDKRQHVGYRSKYWLVEKE